jgi:hypothetical protein
MDTVVQGNIFCRGLYIAKLRWGGTTSPLLDFRRGERRSDARSGEVALTSQHGAHAHRPLQIGNAYEERPQPGVRDRSSRGASAQMGIRAVGRRLRRRWHKADRLRRVQPRCSVPTHVRMRWRREWDSETIARANLPPEWRRSPAPPALAALGDAWVARASSVVLAVPSAGTPDELNYLLNPGHPDFDQVTISPPEPYLYDERVVALTERRGWRAPRTAKTLRSAGHVRGARRQQ